MNGDGELGLQFKCSLQVAIHWGILSDATEAAGAAAESVQAVMSDDFVPPSSLSPSLSHILLSLSRGAYRL